MQGGRTTFAIVATTIGNGAFLDGYCEQARIEGIADDLKIIVIPDRKSPRELYLKCASLCRDGFRIVCPDLPEQERYLSRLGDFAGLIPYDSDNRRNIGFLMALETGADVIVSLDDDNYCQVGTPFFREYALVNMPPANFRSVDSEHGWFNPCDLLEMEPQHSVYPRGFPYSARHQTSPLVFSNQEGLIRMNAGLWLDEPDLDAITWLATPVRARRFRGESVTLGSDTWAPINTQNTSLHRDLLVAYYFVRMGYAIAGLTIDRYGDIFSGYFCQACVHHFGHRVRLGTPVAVHRRNSHDYLRDLGRELACVWILEDLVPWLRELRLEGSGYAEAYLSLADGIEDQVPRFKGAIWNDAAHSYFHDVASCMRRWVAACRTIGI
jgi:hypothetical protein